MTQPTLAVLFDELIPLLEAKRVKDMGTKSLTYTSYQDIPWEPDPAFTPLLAVVQAPCKNQGKRHWHQEVYYKSKDLCGHPYSRAAFWEQADKGALEGALIKALMPVENDSPEGRKVTTLTADLDDLLGQFPDTRIPATQAVLEWMRSI